MTDPPTQLTEPGVVESLLSFVEAARGEPLLPLVVIGVYLVWGAIFVSPWLLTLTVSTVLPPPVSTLVCWIGLNASAAAYYGLGRAFGRRVFARFLGERGKRLVDQAGFEGVVFIRAVPLFPYTVVNLSAGAFGMRFGTYQLATAVGLLPLVLLVTLLGDRAVQVLKNPTPTSIAVLAAFVLLVIAISVGARRLMRRRMGTRLEDNA